MLNLGLDSMNWFCRLKRALASICIVRVSCPN